MTASSRIPVRAIRFRRLARHGLLLVVVLSGFSTPSFATEDPEVREIQFCAPEIAKGTTTTPVDVQLDGNEVQPIVFDAEPRPPRPVFQPRFQAPLRVARQRQRGDSFSTDDEFAAQLNALDNGIDSGCWKPDPLAAVKTDIILPAGLLPRDHAGECLEYTFPMDGCGCNHRGWCTRSYQWAATALCHRPLYFEEPNLERYGYGCHRCLQPFASAAHFFTRVPALPYLMATDCPWECDYTLGHYRPGTRCTPWRRCSVPLHMRGALAQGGAITALVFILP